MVVISEKKTLTKYVYAFVLGDGSLVLGKGRKNATYTCTQISDHRDYMDWQSDILSNLTKVRMYTVDARVDSRGYNSKEQIQLRTNQLPFFTEMRQRIYIGGRKAISPHDLKLLDAEMLAILYMDNGNIWVKENVRTPNYILVELNTHAYSFADNSLLQKAIYEKFGIPFNISPHRSKTGNIHYRLRSKKEYARKFIDIVTPHIKPSFYYKITTVK